MSLIEFAQTLKQWATLVNLKRFCFLTQTKEKAKTKTDLRPQTSSSLYCSPSTTA